MGKKIIVSLFMAVGITCVCEGQTPKRVFRPKKIDSTKNTKLRDLLKLPPTKPVDTLSTPEVVAGLKQALSIGVNNGTGKLGMLDGFFGNAMIKVLLPPEAQKLETTLRSLGFNKMVDDAILSMNRAAEDAAKTAAPLFLDAVSRITIEDAFGILLGADTAATGYLRSRTLQPLTAAFRPIVETSLGKVNATKNWTALATLYNKVARQRVNPDLAGFVTERATAGIFYQLGQEEKEIRKNPLARVTSLLQKVFTPR